MENGTKVNGLYFGTAEKSEAEAGQDHYVFLNATGLRYSLAGNSTTDADFTNHNGYYWSSDAVDNGNSYYLFFDTNNKTLVYNSKSLKGYGLAVRCVRDK